MKFCFLLFICLLVFPLNISSAKENDLIDVSEIFKKKVDSVVTVGAVFKKKTNLGSGFIVHAEGWILTNYHVVKGAEEIIIKLHNEKTYSVKLAGFDRYWDLAVLKIEAPFLKAISLGNSDQLVIGQRVLTIGNPLGLESTIADGLVSAFRQIDGVKTLQISVPLSQGSSGSPLLNLNGEAVGITTATLSQGQNLNFAIPINYAKILLKRSGLNLRETRTRKVSVKESGRKKQTGVEPFRVYVVQSGDTLFGIARQYKTTPTEILELNQLKNTIIKTGDRLRIPFYQ